MEGSQSRRARYQPDCWSVTGVPREEPQGSGAQVVEGQKTKSAVTVFTGTGTIQRAHPGRAHRRATANSELRP